jgi:hypothetical protein
MAKAFAVARLISDDDDEAERIVTEAFRRITIVDPQGDDGSTASGLQLLRMVVEVAGLPSGRATGGSEPVQAEGILNRLFPSAFSLLSRPEKVAVYLTELEGLTPAEAGVVLGTTEETAASIAGNARGRLRDSIARAATSDERDLLAMSLPASWIRTSLLDAMGRRTVQPVGDPSPDDTSETRGLLDTAPPPRRRRDRDLTSIQGSLARVGIACALILAVGFVGLATSRLLGNRAPVDFLSMTEVALSRSAPQLERPNPTEASSFLFAQLGRAVSVPAVRDAPLEGVGVIKIRGDVLTAALYYGDITHSGQIEIAVFTYEQIEQLEETTVVPAGLLALLEEEETVHIAEATKRAAAAWRHRADVYVATGSRESIESLADRLSFAADDRD